MKEESKKPIQKSILDDIIGIMDNITNLYNYCISLEERISNLEIDTRLDKEALDKLEIVREDMESDITHLFYLTHGGDNFCGNCEHCVSCPDGLYRCDLTNLELDLDTSSCIRFKCPQIPKSDAEICKVCSDKDTPRCYKCSHFPF